jgi:hypothetical protein
MKRLAAFYSVCSNRHTELIRITAHFRRLRASGKLNAANVPISIIEVRWVLLAELLMSASSYLRLNQRDLPAGGSVRQIVGYALKSATRTTTIKESQAIRLRLSDGHVELFLNTRHGPGTLNLGDREAMIRCGVALFHLKLALKQFGCLGRVELFPDLDQAGLVARIPGEFSRNFNVQESELLEAMTQSQKDLIPTREAPISESILTKLRHAGAGDAAWLDFSQSESSRQRLLALAESDVRDSMARRRPEHQFTIQVAQDGSRRFQMGRGLAKQLRFAQWIRLTVALITRTADTGRIAVEVDESGAEQMRALAVLKTKTDDKHGWLAGGQVMARARLEAGILDVSSEVFDQAFQKERIRAELRTTIGRKGFAQAIIGFGSRSTRGTRTLSAQ